MEIYFNVIEFGPGIYGIGRAVRHYFGKTPRELLPQEAAFFSSILPNPKKRYVQYCHSDGLLDAKWQNYINRILRRTHERGRLTDEDYEKAIATPLKFGPHRGDAGKRLHGIGQTFDDADHAGHGYLRPRFFDETAENAGNAGI